MVLIKFASYLLNQKLFSDCLKDLCHFKAKNENNEQRQNIVLNTASELRKNLLEIYLDECNKISANKKEMLNNEYSFDNLALDDYEYSSWFEDDEVSSLPSLEGDEEEVKEGT